MKILSKEISSFLRHFRRYGHSGASLGVGENVAGFVVRKVEEIPELFLKSTTLCHEKTGAEYVHLARDDSNNVFSVGFRTIPSDSTGVPHILEHTVLCGSEKYPVRDPFFKMLNRSLSTFMNAMTGPDFTLYPFSTQNEKDYRNLMSVYLDAVFRPKLEKLDFLQEGWRLEPENLEDENSKLIIKGVVFNEMKGVYADPQSLLAQKIMNNLFPSHTYATNYGGDPLKIPDLTWQQLKDFHAKFYHPSNARFMSYGNFPLEKHLEFLNDEYLVKYEKIQPASVVPLERKWPEPRTLTVDCREDPMAPEKEKQTTVAISYSLNDVTDPFETAVLQILSELLLDGPNSPFYKTLLEPNYGIGYSPVTGYDAHTRNGNFTVGLQGIREEDAELIVKIIQDTFKNVVETGFPQERIEALLHKVELSIKHQKSNFGLGLAMSVTPTWNHGGDPVAVLKVNDKINRFRKMIETNPNYLQQKVEEYFVKNSHQLISVMKPVPKYDEQQKAQEEALLTFKTKGLSDNDRKAIIEDARELNKKQKLTEDVSVLPTLLIEDIKLDIDRTSLEHVKLANTTVQLSPQPTNGITYFRAVLSTKDVPDELKLFLPLFCSLATQMGVKGLDYRRFDQEMQLKTGGLGVGHHISESPNSVLSYEEGILLSSHCLDQNIEAMFDLWIRVFNELTLSDISRLETIVRGIVGDSVNSLVHMGHSYAMGHAASCLTPGLLLRENTGGLAFVKHLRNITESGQFDLILRNVQEVAKIVLSNSDLRCAMNFVPASRDSVEKNLEKFLQSVQGSSRTSPRFYCDSSEFKPAVKMTHNVLPVPVNFVSKALPAVPFTSPDFAPLRILCRILSAKYLHTEVREKGGAYGSGVTAGSQGVLQFYSYRDPRCLETLEVFDKSLDWVKANKIEDQTILEAKLSIFQKVDSPTPPGSKGLRLFLNGIDDEMFQKHRAELRNVDRKLIVDVAEKYLTPRVYGVSVLGPHNDSIKIDSSWVVE